VTGDDIRTSVLRILSEIAPEADLTQLKPQTSFREQLDIDSMDLLNFVVALDKELHVEIPEADYGQLSTLEACFEYLAARVT
jgi:acyl carrier protein